MLPYTSPTRTEFTRTDQLSLLFTLSTKVLRILRSPSSMPSPKATKSTATLFFLRRLASLIMNFSSAAWSSRGEPTKTTTRWRRFLFDLCLRARRAFSIAFGMLAAPPSISCASWMAPSIEPISLVFVTSTSGLNRRKVVSREEVHVRNGIHTPCQPWS